MSSINHFFDPQNQDQLCYVQCGYCTTILLVTAPCSILSGLVTVRCGHCTTVLAVDMMKTPTLPLHLFASLNQEEPKAEVCHKEVDHDAAEEGVDLHTRRPSPVALVDQEKEDVPLTVDHVIKPPTRRQRTPSPYNCFIREEIQRLKKEYPGMSHKQAFSTAAKNWAHFPASKDEEPRGKPRDEEPDKV